MKQKKSNKLIAILIILLVILILLAGAAYIYLKTDIFKSNKELFFKYLIQMGEQKEGFIEEQLIEYFEKQASTSYLDEGTISANITTANGQDKFKYINKMNLTFEGQVDKSNSQAVQNIRLNYSDNIKFPLSYKRVGDIAGIQSDYIGSKYIANNLSSEITLPESMESLEKIKEFSDVEFSEEDLKHIINNYGIIIYQELQDSSFSKLEGAENKGYRLALKGEELKSIATKLLETLKNDQRTLDKINEYLKVQKNSLKITTSNIDEAIENIKNNSELDNQNLEITIYRTEGEITSLILKLNEVEAKIEKALTENELQYSLQAQTNFENQTGNISFIARFAGLQSMQSITENYELTLENEEAKYQYNYNNNVEFTDSTSIEAFTDDNSLILNEMLEEQRNTFIEAVIKRIENVNTQKIVELGLQESENLLQYVIPQLDIYSTETEEDAVSEVEVNAFNIKFENYASTSLKGVTVKGLLSTIQLNNELQENGNRKIKEIHFDGQEYEVTDQNIVLIKSSVELETLYRVEFEKDEDTGIIYRAVINKK